ncbi:cation diffusion facilitator family transporter [Aequorivita sp. H23M31]|uniref:Cation diffusion facilitator family transporter n=1 Tax=Aequorivita ciconiae TaxID=2494375 RepID=A0A410FZB8_9FLAO|nr:cation diffusion facilitator family transporter [Aequorivita sp. H23M31]QAA80331.1 cation diffusion facilitator family transporter [Aequorivita sp. H23M31]
MTAKSNFAIYGAITANILIAVSKFIAAIFTGSSAMFAEGIHSIIDTGNGFLLLFGNKKSHRPKDRTHVFGYGMEIYFWSFVVSILIFALGGGFAIYQGIHSLQNPEIIQDPAWNYWVLIAAVFFEGTSLVIAIRSFRKQNPVGSLFSNIIKSKDPANFVIILEDSAAVSGLFIAFMGVFISNHFQNEYADGIASILIGCELLVVAIFLARETKGLLLGESATQTVLKKIQAILNESEFIREFGYPKTSHFGPTAILVIVEIVFKDVISLEDRYTAMEMLRNKIKDKCPEISQVYLQPVRKICSEKFIDSSTDIP